MDSLQTDSLKARFSIHEPADLTAVEDARPELAEPDECVACPDAGCKAMLVAAGLRPTRQRVLLSHLLFSRGDRHVTADMLFTEACDAGCPVAQATVYNTLNQFTQAGLLRRIGPDGSRSFFDTNTTPHPHYYLDGEDMLLDIPEQDVALLNMPDVLPGHEVSRVDLIIHLRRRR
ncbi:Fur family transcriptional regulator Irr [Bradyrhizobium sp.]|uniref:Fur family transcriptional regulator Irr n=1 Tax=Bradyrhizobium sp. TaxID=376 RepID=UPI002D473D32|nr:transcriptional repressor [Bradyrhizobium sp.]HZR73755.1 transcriptional repressor [Bradyrhizobium sp.]